MSRQKNNNRGALWCLKLLICAAFALASTSTIQAAPIWRTDPPGQEPTTYQAWFFDTSDSPTPPEIDNNPYGTATAEITVQGDIDGVAAGWYPQLLDRFGVWHAEMTSILMEIPNRPVSDDYKEIWVEVGFRGVLVESMLIPLPGSTVISLGQEITVGPDGWRVLNIGWRVEPNPEREEVYLLFLDSGASLNYVIVETICIPEPATIGLVIIGGLMLLRRRKAQRARRITIIRFPNRRSPG